MTDQYIRARPPASAPPLPSVPFLRDARLARRLSFCTLAWLGAESVLGMAAGLSAHSVALIGWAWASLVEALASLIVIWRFTGRRLHSHTAEHRARKAVAVSFWVLSPYLVLHVAYDLSQGHRAAPTALGIVVTTISLVSMPLLGFAKRRLGSRLGSAATTGEGTQNLMCALLAAGVLVGLAATSFGWWWVDPAVAVALAVVAAGEGRKAWRGESCRH
ncbi:cation transporter [Sphaerisporangium sp. TRM90804]|uniref:cation transporter n=1 Tax=Sphaerisporangium sp. TRM90804 TaxID=3031113 RepID=UPI00244A68C9|nr:cation transporter [Sphaerisporangium sp. TRM90804]MDH2429079.1 cation transporter [Sphaerisporangium sp. TRM90804]